MLSVLQFRIDNESNHLWFTYVFSGGCCRGRRRASIRKETPCIVPFMGPKPEEVIGQGWIHHFQNGLTTSHRDFENSNSLTLESGIEVKRSPQETVDHVRIVGRKHFVNHQSEDS